MKPDQTLLTEDMLGEQEAMCLFVRIGHMIVENRLQKSSNMKAYGVCHSPDLGAAASLSPSRTRGKSAVNQKLKFLWRNAIPFRIDVILYPCCKHGLHEVSKDVTSSPLISCACLLLERWEVQFSQKRFNDKISNNHSSSKHIADAMKDFLLLSHKGLEDDEFSRSFIPVHRLYAPGEGNDIEFSKEPEIYNFPVIYSREKICVIHASSYPRCHTIPQLSCSRNDETIKYSRSTENSPRSRKRVTERSHGSKSSRRYAQESDYLSYKLDQSPHRFSHLPHRVDHSPHRFYNFLHRLDHSPQGLRPSQHRFDHLPYGLNHSSHRSGHLPHTSDHSLHVSDHSPHKLDNLPHRIDYSPQPFPCYLPSEHFLEKPTKFAVGSTKDKYNIINSEYKPNELRDVSVDPKNISCEVFSNCVDNCGSTPSLKDVNEYDKNSVLECRSNKDLEETCTITPTSDLRNDISKLFRTDSQLSKSTSDSKSLDGFEDNINSGSTLSSTHHKKVVLTPLTLHLENGNKLSVVESACADSKIIKNRPLCALTNPIESCVSSDETSDYSLVDNYGGQDESLSIIETSQVDNCNLESHCDAKILHSGSLSDADERMTSHSLADVSSSRGYKSETLLSDFNICRSLPTVSVPKLQPDLRNSAFRHRMSFPLSLEDNSTLLTEDIFNLSLHKDVIERARLIQIVPPESQPYLVASQKKDVEIGSKSSSDTSGFSEISHDSLLKSSSSQCSFLNDTTPSDSAHTNNSNESDCDNSVVVFTLAPDSDISNQNSSNPEFASGAIIDRNASLCDYSNIRNETDFPMEIPENIHSLNSRPRPNSLYFSSSDCDFTKSGGYNISRLSSDLSECLKSSCDTIFTMTQSPDSDLSRINVDSLNDMTMPEYGQSCPVAVETSLQLGPFVPDDSTTRITTPTSPVHDVTLKQLLNRNLQKKSSHSHSLLEKHLLKKDFSYMRQAKNSDERSSKGCIVPSEEETSRFRSRMRKSHSAVFNSNTGLPTRSSPAPAKRRSGCFDYDSSLKSVHAIKNALSCSLLMSESGDHEYEQNSLSKSAPASTNCLLGNFEESMLNGRLEPIGIVQGFTAEIGVSGSFCPKHITLPVTAYFFCVSDDNAPSPYLGHVDLEGVGKKGYHVPRVGTVQVTLFNPNGTVVKMFVVRYDWTDMPVNCQTFLRQRTLYTPVDRHSSSPSYLRYLIHLRFRSSKSSNIYLHTDIRLIFARGKCEVDPNVADYELLSYTEGPTNPKYSPIKK